MMTAGVLVTSGPAVAPAEGGPPEGCNPIPIDTGATSQQAAGQDEVGNPVDVATSRTGDGILGEERDISVTNVTGNLGSEGVHVKFRRTGGALAATWSDDVLHSMVGTIVYDGIDNSPVNVNPTGLGGLDLTGAGAESEFVVVVDRLDHPGAPGPTIVPATIDVYSDAANASRLTIDIEGPIPVGESATFDFLLAEFTPFLGAGADFTNVGAISLSLNTGAGGLDAVDMLITAFTVCGPPPELPPPPPPPPPTIRIPPRFTG